MQAPVPFVYGMVTEQLHLLASSIARDDFDIDLDDVLLVNIDKSCVDVGLKAFMGLAHSSPRAHLDQLPAPLVYQLQINLAELDATTALPRIVSPSVRAYPTLDNNMASSGLVT